MVLGKTRHHAPSPVKERVAYSVIFNPTSNSSTPPGNHRLMGQRQPSDSLYSVQSMSLDPRYIAIIVVPRVVFGWSCKEWSTCVAALSVEAKPIFPRDLAYHNLYRTRPLEEE